VLFRSFYINPPSILLKIMPPLLKGLSKIKGLPVLLSLILGLLKQQRRIREKLQSKGLTRMAKLFTDVISLPGKSYKKNGFATPSGKVELYSTVLEKLGYDPLPYFKDPLESQDHLADDYPLLLFVGEREDEYFISGGRHVEYLRKRNPDPQAYINTQTAKKSGIATGDWIWVETPHGRIELKAELRDTMPEELVRIPHGWWRPEEPQGTPHLSGALKHSDNVVLSDDDIYMDAEQGLIDLRGGRRCRVSLMNPE
jgi:anaerobic selenocysteine-containing dehydrogenase